MLVGWCILLLLLLVIVVRYAYENELLLWWECENVHAACGDARWYDPLCSRSADDFWCLSVDDDDDEDRCDDIDVDVDDARAHQMNINLLICFRVCRSPPGCSSFFILLHWLPANRMRLKVFRSLYYAARRHPVLTSLEQTLKKKLLLKERKD